MKPNFEEVQDGAEILVLAQDADGGPIQFKGELHDRATYRYCWGILQVAKVSGQDISAEALRRFF